MAVEQLKAAGMGGGQGELRPGRKTGESRAEHYTKNRRAIGASQRHQLAGLDGPMEPAGGVGASRLKRFWFLGKAGKVIGNR